MVELIFFFFQVTHRFLKKGFIILSNYNFCLNKFSKHRHGKKAIKAGYQFFDIAECYISLSGNPWNSPELEDVSSSKRNFPVCGLIGFCVATSVHLWQFASGPIDRCSIEDTASPKDRFFRRSIPPPAEILWSRS